MLAELAAANAAFSVIKAALANGKELSDIGSKALEYFDYKAKLQESATEKAGGRPIEGRSDLEEFMALEKLRQQEEHLKEQMVYAGRPGMWTDWVKFQTMAAKRRREAKEEAHRQRIAKIKRRREIAQVVLVILAGALVLAMTLFGVWLVAGRR
jgi:hypothetical protein